MRIRRFAVYAAVGATGTAVQYLTLVALVGFGLAAPLIASCIGAVLGAVCNYLLNYRLTFRSNNRHAATAPRFFAVAAAALLVNWASMRVLLSVLGDRYLIAQCLSTGVVLVLTYTVNAMWSFKASPSA